MKSCLRTVDDHGHIHERLYFVCPGCVAMKGGSGLHGLPVRGDSNGAPMWQWDGNLEAPTFSPSILTGRGTDQICHSFLRNGHLEFLSDCNHELASQTVPLPDLPEWVAH